MNTALEPIVRETRAWVDRAVIGLNLCPFANAVQARGLVRYAVSDTTDPQVLLATLCDEMRWLHDADPADVETTLLIHPFALIDFDDFNHFLGAAEAAVHALGLAGVLQIASFHPHYRFAGTAAEDLSNATNRSPYPCLHLLREASVTRALAARPEPQTIFETNIRTLAALGSAGWATLQAACRLDGAETADSPDLKRHIAAPVAPKIVSSGPE